MRLKKLLLPNGSIIPINSVRLSVRLLGPSLCIAALLGLYSLSATAQVKNPSLQSAESSLEQSSSPTEPQAKDLRNKRDAAAEATDLLLTVAEGSRKWDNHGAAANIQAQVADLVWNEMSGVGRKYLLMAWETTASIAENEERSPFRNESQKTQARRQVLLIAKKRVPILAQKWINEMAEEAQREENTKRGTFDDRTSRSSVLLQMALASVNEQPGVAADLAIESLQDGISFGLQSVLIALQTKDFSLAERVFRAALTRLQTAGMFDPSEILILHAYLYTPGTVFSINASNNSATRQIAVGRDRPRITLAAELNATLALQFLKTSASLLINAAPPSSTSNPEYAARAQLSVINVLMEKLTRYLPEEAVALQIKAQQIATDANYAKISQPTRPDVSKPRPEETTRNYTERRLNELEEVAERTSDPLARDIGYAKAALATDAEQYQRGWSLAAKIRDESLRDNISNWLSYRAALHFAKADDLDRLYELARKNNDMLQRAACLVVGAQKLVKLKEIPQATQWLTEARSVIRRVDGSDSDLPRVMIGLVSTYAQFDTWEALAVLSDAIKVMNKIPGANYHDNDRVPLIRRFSGFGVLADFTYGTSGFSLTTALEGFPEDKFYDIVYKLNDLSSPETRGRAVVLLCQKQLNLTRQRRSSIKR